MFLSAYLFMLLSQRPPDDFVPANTADLMRLAIKPETAAWTFDWSDAEDRVRGSLTPKSAGSGDPITISVAVGSFASGDFDGPVTIGLEQVDGPWKELATVPPPPGDKKLWTATFVPPETGEYAVKITYRSSHQKGLRGTFEVSMGHVPKFAGLAVALTAITLAVVYGLFLLFKKTDGAEQP